MSCAQADREGQEGVEAEAGDEAERACAQLLSSRLHGRQGQDYELVCGAPFGRGQMSHKCWCAQC